MISIIGCGMGNLGSIENMLQHIGVEVRVISTESEVLEAEKIILPGVGSWDHGISRLQSSGLIPSLNEMAIKKKIPVLGICLGMQLLANKSEEGDLAGLGWIPGKVVKIKDDGLTQKLRVPHMGWNSVHQKKQSALTCPLPHDSRFYFVHSYKFCCDDPNDELLICHYGKEFICAVNRDNIWGVQFHPEKSHRFGMSLLASFSEL